MSGKHRKTHRVRRVARTVAHAAWFGLELNGATMAGDAASIRSLLAAEHERQSDQEFEHSRADYYPVTGEV